MEKRSDKSKFDCNRRDFLKIAGIGAAAMSVPAMGLISNAGAASMNKVDQDIVEDAEEDARECENVLEGSQD